MGGARAAGAWHGHQGARRRRSSAVGPGRAGGGGGCACRVAAQAVAQQRGRALVDVGDGGQRGGGRGRGCGRLGRLLRLRLSPVAGSAQQQRPGLPPRAWARGLRCQRAEVTSPTQAAVVAAAGAPRGATAGCEQRAAPSLAAAHAGLARRAPGRASGGGQAAIWRPDSTRPEGCTHTAADLSSQSGQQSR